MPVMDADGGFLKKRAIVTIRGIGLGLHINSVQTLVH